MAEESPRQEMSLDETTNNMDERPSSPKIARAVFSDRKFFELENKPLTDEFYEWFLDRMERTLGNRTLDEVCCEVYHAGQLSRKTTAEEYLLDKIDGRNKEEVHKVYNHWWVENFAQRAKPGRMVRADYHIQDTPLANRYDLDCFTERVQELFQWWEETDPKKKYVGPYLCMIQSSGMGKTKLMFEYKSNPHNDVDAFLILPNSTTRFLQNKAKPVFDYALDLDLLQLPVFMSYREGAWEEATTQVFEMLDKMLHELLQKKNDLTNKNETSQRIVLLFDEANFLLEQKLKEEAFFFRCIRVWLRQKRPHDQRVVGVFAGTNAQLADFEDASDAAIEAKEAPLTEERQKATVESKEAPMAEEGQSIIIREYHEKGFKCNPPFVQTRTMGCCRASFPEDPSMGEFGRAVNYGRPVFAVMAKDGILEQKLATVLTLNHFFDTWDESRHTLINLLFCRVSMGQTTMAMTSELVAKGYANLLHYSKELEVAQLAYLPDPACARLAMCLMDEECTPAQFVTGKRKRWWAWELKEFLSSGIIIPENGDFGEVIMALYMLFCGDLLRKRFNNHKQKKVNQKAYIQFSVSLDEWLQLLQSGGKMPDETNTTISKADNPCKVSVGFIQVCRNSLRSYGKSWKSLDNNFLKQVYESGTAFFVFPGCPLIDLVIPLRVTTTIESEFEFVPMLVSMQFRSSFSNNAAQTICDKMKEQATQDGLARALCLVIIYGSEPSPESNNSVVEGVSEELVMGVVSRVIRVPDKDEFALNEVFRVMTPKSQLHADLFGSFLKALGESTDEQKTSSRA